MSAFNHRRPRLRPNCHRVLCFAVARDAPPAVAPPGPSPPPSVPGRPLPGTSTPAAETAGQQAPPALSCGSAVRRLLWRCVCACVRACVRVCAAIDTSPLTPIFDWPVAASAEGLEADAAGGAAGLGGPGSVHQRQGRAARPHQRAAPLVVPPRRPAPVHSAPRFTPRLLPVPVFPVGALQDVGVQACVSSLWAEIDRRWPVQDRPEGLGHEQLVLHGHGVPGMPFMSQEVLGVGAGHLGPAGPSAPGAVSSCPHVQVSVNTRESYSRASSEQQFFTDSR